MTTARRLLSLLIFLLFSFLSACSGRATVTPSVDAAATQNAQAMTSSAMQTQIAGLRTQLAQITAAAVHTSTPTRVRSTSTPRPPTSTSAPSPTPLPPTETPTITPVPLPCNAAEFIADVTLPDGTIVSPNIYLSKTWRLKNAGSCTWTMDYSLVRTGGDTLGAQAVIHLPGNVNPGQVIDLTVDLTAPSQPGHYRGFWKLRDASGTTFGLKPRNSNFFVDIRVSEPEVTNPLDFIASYCQAEWSSGAGRLPCQGGNNDARGYVIKVDNPRLESGYTDNEPVLVTHPQMIADGVIRGKYPVVFVRSGYHFVAVLGCAYQANNCDVNFQLDYQIGDGSIQTLAAWNETYDEQYNEVDVDLSDLAGQEVNFILTVFANGPATQDRAQWLAPKIIQR